MRSARYALAAVAACLLMGGQAEARSHRAHRAVAPQPTSAELLQSMLTAADEWWTEQGSPPPCPNRPDVQWAQVGVYVEWAFYDSCVMMLSPHWWATQYAYLTGRARVGLRRRAAAYDLALLMHARGHNLGYRHIPGTVMQGDEQGPLLVPGWAFEWAARTIR